VRQGEQVQDPAHVPAYPIGATFDFPTKLDGQAITGRLKVTGLRWLPQGQVLLNALEGEADRGTYGYHFETSIVGRTGTSWAEMSEGVLKQHVTEGAYKRVS